MCEKEENNNIQKSIDLVLNENSRMKRKYDQINKSVEISYNDETGIEKKIKLDSSNISIELDKGSDENFYTKNQKNDVQILPHSTMFKREFTVIKASNIIQFYNDQQCTGIVNERFKSGDAKTKSNIVCSKISNLRSDSDDKLSKIIQKENCVLKSLTEKQEKGKTSTEQHLTKQNSNMKMNSISCQTIRSPLLSIEIIKDDVKAIEFFTGLQSFEKFIYAFKLLGRDAYDLNYYYPIHEISLSILDQFFMTLVILKLHKSHYEISILFQISLRDIKNIFITWVRFMQLEWCHLKLPKAYQPKISVESIFGVKQYSANSDNSATKIQIHDKKKIPVINLVSEEVSDNFKKVYKILNGPDNYMEKHLMRDIIFVCHVLCYFRVKRISSLYPVKIENQ